jgi:DivIVA domain-containing protein
MDFSPQTVRSAGFKTVKKGYDPAEVDDFKQKVALAIETAQNQATAMEARARAAVAKLQEVSQQVTSGPRDANAGLAASDEDAETISRTLLLAQRTADNTISQANSEAETITVRARVDATTVIDNARAMADKLLDEARLEARRSAESERIKAENEVQSLLARRDFLVSDVDHLEHHVDAQRERLRDAAVSIQELIERVPGGLGEMRRPLLSASAEAQQAAAPKATTPASPPPAAPAVVEAAPPPAAEVVEAMPDAPADARHWQSAASDDETAAMTLDLASADVDALEIESPTPSMWSISGNDPLIVGDELQ